ncbi:IS110 family transposase [Reichenbachiella ulvae]|uniref:IS110 family transposase n=1 Tax=Reichenbachiella ulvae TaxID=2980104 RepID=A0ABT3CUU2_9BACT|nr:IS110 family transposase [Reichenbachiella ulvae]MCV9387461.1 IS110 family transposase [Reichenbachiella ulvae]
MKVVGIDISKRTFDVSFKSEGKWFYKVFPNTSKGFTKLLQLLEDQDKCVMEASGPYYLPLALFLDKKGVFVSVENPLVIKRFSQMKLIRAKTDKKDARTIAEYASIHPLKQWTDKSKTIIKMQQILTAIDGFKKQLTMVRNQKEAFDSTKLVDTTLRKSLESLQRHIQKQIDKLEAYLTDYAQKEYAATMEKLTSIPGIGQNAAIILVLLTEDFTKFENYKQLIAYVGMSPRIYQSGTSVRGKGRICKMGNSQVRKVLYMCSWSAKRYNQACIDMYHRLAEKGKNERVIKIALANKLLKQCFAIAKGESLYQKNYQPIACI